MSAVKDWEKELYIYRLNPSPPKKDDLQEYIDLYLESKDEKYIEWFLHYYEPVLNDTVMGIVQRYAMYGHFIDIKQSCVVGIYTALEKYDKTKNVPFITFKVRIMWDEIHDYIRTMRNGFSVESDYVYGNLRNIMWLYSKYGNSEEAIEKISEEVGLSEKLIAEMVLGGTNSTKMTEFYISYSDEDSEETLTDVTVDYTLEPSRVLEYIERINTIQKAFSKLDYREYDIVTSHLGLCPDCMRFTLQKKDFKSLATKYVLTSEQAVENVYHKAIRKIQKHLKENL